MNRYSSLCDDFYVNMNLSTEMELPNNRETVLHYFERIQKKYPTMRNFYCREKGDFVLEELAQAAVFGINPAQQFTFVEAEADGVISLALTRRPGGFLASQNES